MNRVMGLCNVFFGVFLIMFAYNRALTLC